MKMIWETHKIFEVQSIMVYPTCVRIPVFHGHSETVHIETKSKISAAEARELLQNTEGIVVIDEMVDGGYPTAVSEAVGEDSVFVGRIREDISTECGLNLWIVSDNLRKGAALNSIQIAEVLLKRLK
jgi:aspartate-semialdehyde dehydrogenase